MLLLENDLNSIHIQFSIDELYTIHQSLNEVCNGIDLFEFQTRMGVTREEVSKLMKGLSKIINEIEINQSKEKFLV